jgi:5-formyltetrahydrofolate cyclo-ligase
MTSKPELRATMRALRKRLAEASPDAAIRAASFIDALPQGQMVAVYRAVGAELDPEPLATALERAGRSLCLPVALERDAALTFRRWTPGNPLEMDVAGCPAPLPLAETVTPDVIMTPLLAFDAEGGRLGQGGGYYDRTFAALPKAIRIGLAYAGQAVSLLPSEPHDFGLDGVLTEIGYSEFRQGARA